MRYKLRLDYFLSKGGKLTEGDIYTGVYNDNVLVTSTSKDYQNAPLPGDNERFIKSFAPRKNEGVIPCDWDLPLVATLATGARAEGFAGELGWGGYAANKLYIDTWVPNLSALIGIQKEHDAKRGMNKPKPKTIMDALNWFKGEVPKLFNQTGNILVECIRMHYGCPLDVVGGIYAGGGGFDDKHFRQVCTKEEYEALVEELSRPEKEEPKVYTQAMSDAGERPVVGVDCIVVNCGNESAGEILFISGQYCIQKQGDFEQHYHTNGLSFKPIDTRTEKEKVIDYISERFAGYNGHSHKATATEIYDKFIAKK